MAQFREKVWFRKIGEGGVSSFADGRKSRYIGKVLGWYRGEDAGDLKKSELNDWTWLNAF